MAVAGFRGHFGLFSHCLNQVRNYESPGSAILVLDFRALGCKIIGVAPKVYKATVKIGDLLLS